MSFTHHLLLQSQSFIQKQMRVFSHFFKYRFFYTKELENFGSPSPSFPSPSPSLAAQSNIIGIEMAHNLSNESLGRSIQVISVLLLVTRCCLAARQSLLLGPHAGKHVISSSDIREIATSRGMHIQNVAGGVCQFTLPQAVCEGACVPPTCPP